MKSIKSLPHDVTEHFHLTKQMRTYYRKLFNSNPDPMTHQQMIDIIKIDLLLKLHATETTPYLDMDDLFDTECLES